MVMRRLDRLGVGCGRSWRGVGWRGEGDGGFWVGLEMGEGWVVSGEVMEGGGRGEVRRALWVARDGGFGLRV